MLRAGGPGPGTTFLLPLPLGVWLALAATVQILKQDQWLSQIGAHLIDPSGLAQLCKK